MAIFKGTSSLVNCYKGAVQIQKIYKGLVEIWSSWNGQLYDAGNEYTDKTGGWDAYALMRGGGTNPFAPTLTKNASNMVATLYFPATKRYGALFALNQINLTPYTTLKMNYSVSMPFASTALGLVTTASRVQNYTPSASVLQVVSATNATLSVDVSALNSLQYIGVEMTSENTLTGTMTLTINKIWLE